MLRVQSIHGGSPAGGTGGGPARAVAAYLTEYLVAAKEEPGVWVGDAARRLALEGQVERADLVAVLEGRDPRDRGALGRVFTARVLTDGRVVRPVIGFDATFSAPKSVSVMWALTQDEGWAQAHDGAVRAVIDHVQAWGATTRVRVRGGREFPDTGGLIVAVFRQHTSRADDPQLHTHTFISSKVQTADGGWWALDARYLKRYQRMLGGLYQSVLRAELTARYGVAWGAVVNGQAELAEVPGELIEQFSKRSGQLDPVVTAKVEVFTGRNGRPPTSYERAALIREAALDSRDPKAGNTVGVLLEDWAGQAAGLGWDRERLTHHVTPIEQVRAARQSARSLGVIGLTGDWVAHQGDADGLWDRVTSVVSRASTWHRGDVVRAVTDLTGAPAVMSGARWAHLIDTTVDGYLRARCVNLDPPSPDRGDGGVRGDGRSVRIDPMVGPYTTGAILAQEEHLITWALDHTPDVAHPSVTTARVLTGGIRLDSTQHAAAAAVAGHDELVVIVGPAGTGKTTMLAAAVTDLHTQGRGVFGVAPSNQAAHVLAVETAMATDSVAKLLYEHARADRSAGSGWQLAVGTTVVVDEAGMLATGDLYELTVLADRYRWRLVLVGDPFQLPAVGRGGMFGELAGYTTPIELDRVRRFTNDWEGPASLALRRADPTVIDTYERHGRVRAGTFDDLATAVTEVWLRDRDDGRTVAITAATNDEVDRLNTSIQNARLQLGHLDPAWAVPGGGGDRLHPGDLVATRANRRDLTTTSGVMIKNRALWTVAHTAPGTGDVTLVGADGTVTVPADYVRDHVRLAYAATVYGTQGATMDHAITMVSGATDHRNLYVGATRGRDSNELYVIADDVTDARDVLDDALARDRVDTPAVAVRRDLLHQTHGHERLPGPVADPVMSDPFAGLETVREALARYQTEQAQRDAPRQAHRMLRSDLANLQAERARLDRPWSPYEHSPLDHAHLARHNAQVSVNELTARLQSTSWRDRRHVRHQLTDATQQLEKATTAYQERYQQELDRLDPLITQAEARLEHTSIPDPVDTRDHQLEQNIAWLRWETSVGNSGRPTLDALEQHRGTLEQITRGRTRTHHEQAVYQALTGELDDRDLQYQHAIDAQQQALRVRHQERQRPERDLGPDLGR